ncbi:Kelch repeat-containing protein [Streptomyces sp. NPDC056975]|uniref:Kelch repeat-containing protein n=1 Tax=Streptomyces sp. NPDC056975 TaxID=3345985 RepID=UPI0036434EE8
MVDSFSLRAPRMRRSLGRMRPQALLAALLLLAISACGTGGNTVHKSYVPSCLKVSGQPADQHNTWSPTAPMPTRRYLLAAATGCDGSVYAIGGLAAMTEEANSDVGLSATVEVYTPSTGTWTAAASMPTPRAGLGAATGHDGRIYTIGGSVDEQFGSSSIVEVYDPKSNAWSTALPLPIPLANVGATTDAEGNIYAIGPDVMEIYEADKNAWKTAAAMPKKRDRMVVAAGRDNKIYAFGGYDESSNSGPVATAEVYDPRTGKWSELASMPSPLGQTAGVTGLDGKIYVIGGDVKFSAGSQSATSFVYDPKTNSWSKIAPLPEGRNSHAAAIGPDGRIYVMGGDTGSTEERIGTTRRVDAYTP